jgi:hypothetical protein
MENVVCLWHALRPLWVDLKWEVALFDWVNSTLWLASGLQKAFQMHNVCTWFDWFITITVQAEMRTATSIEGFEGGHVWLSEKELCVYDYSNAPCNNPGIHLAFTSDFIYRVAQTLPTHSTTVAPKYWWGNMRRPDLTCDSHVKISIMKTATEGECSKCIIWTKYSIEVPRTQWPPFLNGKSLEPPRLFLELAARAKLSIQRRGVLVREVTKNP